MQDEKKKKKKGLFTPKRLRRSSVFRSIEMSFDFPEGWMEIAMLSEHGLLIKFTMISR